MGYDLDKYSVVIIFDTTSTENQSRQFNVLASNKEEAIETAFSVFDAQNHDHVGVVHYCAKRLSNRGD